MKSLYKHRQINPGQPGSCQKGFTFQKGETFKRQHYIRQKPVSVFQIKVNDNFF
jgi:hypothetical protein